MKHKTNELGQFVKVERDLTGQKFNKLTAINRLYQRRGKEKVCRWYWECLCDCGDTATVLEYSLYAGKTQSCGCAMLQNNALAKPYGQSSHSTQYGRYKNAANQRNLIFNLSKEEFLKLTTQNCFYCGAEPKATMFNKRSNGPAIVNGIDRIDNSKGYYMGNCVPCCEKCNRAKMTMSVDDFYKMIIAIFNHRKLGQI